MREHEVTCCSKFVACRTSVIFCVGAKARRARSASSVRGEVREPPLTRNSRFALASRLPRFRPCSPEIRKKSRLFCRLQDLRRFAFLRNTKELD